MKLLAFVLLAIIAGCHGATLDATTMVNTSALYGSTATFTCSIGGTQGSFETLTFTKLNPDGVTFTTLSSDATPANATKHSVSGTYSLTINDVVWTDEGQYTCSLSGVGSATAYLTVGIAPTTGFLYWADIDDNDDDDNDGTWTPKDQKNNLTCEAGTARPPATFRWFRGTTQVTTGIINPTSTVDINGYGTAISMIEMTPTSTDEGANYTCFIDAAGTPGVNVLTKSLPVAFSGAGSVVLSINLVLAAFLTFLRL